MNHPNTPVRHGETAQQLSSDYKSQRRGQLVRLSVRSRTSRLRGALLGAVVGAVAVFVLCLVENQPFHWYSAAWEVGFCGVAGYLLARWGGGFLNGLTLFGFAYMATILLRELGHDSSVVIGHLAKARAVSLHGDFAMLMSIAVVGGLIGFTSDRR